MFKLMRRKFLPNRGIKSPLRPNDLKRTSDTSPNKTPAEGSTRPRKENHNQQVRHPSTKLS
jgi:hypothetical protein